MRRVSTFETQKFEVEFEFGDVFTFHPIGDIHRESSLCSREKFKAWCDDRRKERDQGKNNIFLGMGDYSDFASISEQYVFTNPKTHEQTIEDTLDRVAMENTDNLMKEMNFINKKNCIGMMEGNHYWTLSKPKVTTTQYMCQALDVPYLGLMCVIRLIFKHKKDKSNSMAIVIVAHHGRGGGRTLGVSVNHVSDLKNIFPDGDIYVMGDDHKKWTYSTSRLTLSKNYDRYGRPIVRNKKTILCRSGGFLRGYVPGKQSYIAQKALPPTDIGAAKINIIPKLIRYSEGGRTFKEREIYLEGIS